MCTTEVHEVRGGGVGSAATVAAPVARVVGAPPMTGWTWYPPVGCGSDEPPEPEPEVELVTATWDAEPVLPLPCPADVIEAAPVEPEAPLWLAVAAPAAADCASAAPPASAAPAAEVSAVLLVCPELA